MYKTSQNDQQQQPNTNTQQESKTSDSEVTDVDFEEVKN